MRIIANLIAVFCFLPLSLLIFAWITPLSKTSQDNWQHLISTVLFFDISQTLMLAFGVFTLVLIMGVSTAWLLTNYEFHGSKALSWLIIMPFAMPSYLLAMSYGSMLEYAGPVQSTLRAWFEWERSDYFFPSVRSLGGAIVIMSLSGAPYVYMLARLAFRSQPRLWSDMSASLGKTHIQIFWQVALPAARPFVFIGAILAVMESAADIGTVHMLGVSTLATGVLRSWFNMQEPMLAARMASLLLIFAAFLLWFERYNRKGIRYDSLQSHSHPQHQMRGLRAWLAFIYCALPFVFGFLIPVLWIMRMSFYNSTPVNLSEIILGGATSLGLAVFAAIIVVAAALVLIYAQRQQKSRLILSLAALLGYAMPGVVIAIGLLTLQKLTQQHLGIPLIFTGSILGLMVAYLIRFLSPAYTALNAGTERISPELDMAAQALGKTAWQIFWKIHIPLLRLPILTAGLMVAIDVFKELPATMIMRPYDVKTLALSVYEFASDDRPTQAAPFALAMIVISTLAVYVLHRLQRNSNGAA